MKPYAPKNFLLFILAMSMVGCATEKWVMQKNGQAVSDAEMNMDSLRCEREAAKTYPYAPESASIPSGYSGGSSTTCVPVGNTIRCNTSGGGSPAPLVLPYDGNSDRREKFQGKCMAALGYQRIPIQNSGANSVKPIATAYTPPKVVEYAVPWPGQFVATQRDEQAIIDAALPSSNVTVDHSIGIMAPNISENGAVVPVEIRASRPFSKGERLYLVVNGSFIGATLTPYDSRTQIDLSIRVKMPGTGLLKAVLVDAAGHMRIVAREVKVTVGANPNQISEQPELGPMQIRTVVKNGNLQIKSLMNSSQNSDMYIKTISYLVDGTKVAEVELPPGSSKNPYVSIKINGSGKQVEMQVRTSNGRSNTTATYVN